LLEPANRATMARMRTHPSEGWTMSVETIGRYPRTIYRR